MEGIPGLNDYYSEPERPDPDAETREDYEARTWEDDYDDMLSGMP